MASTSLESSPSQRRPMFHFAEYNSNDDQAEEMQGDVSGTLFASIPAAQPVPPATQDPPAAGHSASDKVAPAKKKGPVKKTKKSLPARPSAEQAVPGIRKLAPASGKKKLGGKRSAGHPTGSAHQMSSSDSAEEETIDPRPGTSWDVSPVTKKRA